MPLEQYPSRIASICSCILDVAAGLASGYRITELELLGVWAGLAPVALMCSVFVVQAVLLGLRLNPKFCDCASTRHQPSRTPGTLHGTQSAAWPRMQTL